MVAAIRRHYLSRGEDHSFTKITGLEWLNSNVNFMDTTMYVSDLHGIVLVANLTHNMLKHARLSARSKDLQLGIAGITNLDGFGCSGCSTRALLVHLQRRENRVMRSDIWCYRNKVRPGCDRWHQ